MDSLIFCGFNPAGHYSKLETYVACSVGFYSAFKDSTVTSRAQRAIQFEHAELCTATLPAGNGKDREDLATARTVCGLC